MGEDTKDEKMVGAMLTQEYRDRLAEIQKHHGRTFRAQLEKWIEFEHRMIAVSRA